MTPPKGRPDRAAMRENYRKQLQDSIGGWSGMVITGLPTVVFVIVNVATTLRIAIFAAIGASVVLAGYRLARKQPVQQAISGLFGVLIAAVIAARTGQARGYFLFGIWASFVYAVPFAVSIVIRRPLVGWLWEFLDPAPPDPDAPDLPWYRRRPLLRAYTWATLIGTVLFLARGVVQATLYHEKATGWLAVAKIVMGTPLYVVAVLAGYWVVRRVRHQLPKHITDELTAPGVGEQATDDGTTHDPAGGAGRSADDGAPDRRFRLG